MCVGGGGWLAMRYSDTTFFFGGGGRAGGEKQMDAKETTSRPQDSETKSKLSNLSLAFPLD